MLRIKLSKPRETNMQINQFFENKQCDIKALANYLDQLEQKQRIHEVTSLTASQQKMLWFAAEGSERLTMDFFVPANKPALEQVIHWGQNSLPFATKFQKVMCRTSNTVGHAGYNVSPLAWLVGNGFFVTRATTDADFDNHGIVVDYTQVPSEASASWPAIKVCGKDRLGIIPYAGNHDFMRKVSQHVSIGRAKKANSKKWMPNWFVLCRED